MDPIEHPHYENTIDPLDFKAMVAFMQRELEDEPALVCSCAFTADLAETAAVLLDVLGDLSMRIAELQEQCAERVAHIGERDDKADDVPPPPTLH